MKPLVTQARRKEGALHAHFSRFRRRNLAVPSSVANLFLVTGARVATSIRAGFPCLTTAIRTPQGSRPRLIVCGSCLSEEPCLPDACDSS